MPNHGSAACHRWTKLTTRRTQCSGTPPARTPYTSMPHHHARLRTETLPTRPPTMRSSSGNFRSR
ncbi:hypothetical protein V8C43DRAFT_285385 [Trichoderma afarasin]